MFSKFIQCMHDLSGPTAVVAIAVLWMQTRFDAAQGAAAFNNASALNRSAIVPLDGGRFHLDAIVTRDGLLRLLFLSGDITELHEAAPQTPIAHVYDENGRVFTVPLRPEQQTGDRPGRTSQFLGELPFTVGEQRLHIAISNLQIGGRMVQANFDWRDLGDWAGIRRGGD